MKICYNCFGELKADEKVCPRCGCSADLKNEEKYPNALTCGTILNGRYIVGRVLGQGGFGITYVAWDYQSKNSVAIKEYFPDTMAIRTDHISVFPYNADREESYTYGKEKFLQEAKTLFEFGDNPNIVNVLSFFEENGTAYFVMEYVSGDSLKNLLAKNKKEGGGLSWEETIKIVLPIMDALSTVHEKGIIHRDVAPDNIAVMPDGKTKLLDFGAARYSMGEKSQSISVILKHGFAPSEQYARHGRQGPYTDVYAMGATIYNVLTGRIPSDSVERNGEDDLVLPSALGSDIPPYAERALVKALAVNARDRFQTMSDFKNALIGVSETPDQEDIASGTPVSNTSVGETASHKTSALGESDRKNDSEPLSDVPAGKRKKRFGLLFVPIAILAAVIIYMVYFSVSRVKICGETFKKDTTYVSIKNATLSSKDLKKLTSFSRLYTLNLEECKFEGDDLSGILLTNLQTLRLTYCELTEKQTESLDFSAFEKLANLDLTGSKSGFRDLSMLSPVSSRLKELNISETSISDLSGIEEMKELWQFYASDCGIREISLLSGLTSLEYLDLSGNEIETLEPLKEMENLQELIVSRNALKDLTGIENCLHLRKLYSDDNHIQSLDCLRNATILEDVLLQNNEIEKIDVLAKSAASLKKLNLSGNQISDLSALSGASALLQLNISNNRIASLDPLSGCTALEDLYASHNEITSLTALNDLPALKTLDLSNNALEGIIDLGNSTNWAAGEVNGLYLQHNNITGLRLPENFVCELLDIHSNSPDDETYVSLGSVKGKISKLVLDYSEGLERIREKSELSASDDSEGTDDSNMFRSAQIKDMIILDCPPDRQVALEKVSSGIRITMTTTQEYEEDGK